MKAMNESVDVVVTRLVASPDAVRAAAAVLSDAERLRASRFSSARKRRRFTVARARLRQLLAERLGVQPESVELCYGARGKPALAQRFADADLRFNGSHCGDLVVYAFSSGREIGVDVEAIRKIRSAEDIVARFFSRREQEAYWSIDQRDRPLGFLNCWTRKEAFLKALGDGLSRPLDRFDVSLVPGEPARILRVEDTPGDRCGWEMESFEPAPGFVGAVVAQARHVHST